MKRIAGFLFFDFLFSVFALGQVDTVQKIIPGRANSPSQQGKPYVILISADGFRYDYAEKYAANHLLQLGSSGVRAASMIPSYPSLTFPNHYTIVTGMYPSHHGIVSNYFYEPDYNRFYGMRDTSAVKDGSRYGGIPLWVLAEQQHMLSASFYWVGSEAPIQGILPTYYYSYNEKISMDRRIQIVLDWLSMPPEKRPHLITFYLPEVDHAGHKYGPDARQTGDAVRFVDSSIQKLVNAVSQTGLPVNYLFLADHGMTRVDREHPLQFPSFIDSSQFNIPRGFELISMHAKSGSALQEIYQKLRENEKGYKVYLKTEMPAYLHYGDRDDRLNRIGDILLVPRWPKAFTSRGRKPDPGAHGFDPYEVKDMQAVFYAWGPAFRQVVIPSFENVQVFPVLAKILGLQYEHEIDGTPELADKILK